MWNPEKILLGELSFVFDMGLPFALLGNNPSAEVHKKKVSDAIQSGQSPREYLWSEVQVGALFSNWGKKVSFVKEGATTTPDLEVTLDNGMIVDVEVTRAEIIQMHEATRNGLANLAGALRAGDVEWNVVCFFADASNPGDLYAAFEAAIALRPGDIKESRDRWAVRAVALERREEVVGAEFKQLFGPSWWPLDEPCYLVNSTLVGPRIPPVVALYSLIPAASYLNPLRRKADTGQRRPGHPYLIALDVTEMPGAHERIAKDLNDYFSIRDHVSGVFLFDSRFWIGCGRKEWAVSVHANPNARFSIPADLTDVSDGQRHSVQFLLSS